MHTKLIMLSAKKGKKVGSNRGSPDAAASDSELKNIATYGHRPVQQIWPSAGRYSTEDYRGGYSRMLDPVDEQTDEEEKSTYTLDEFGENLSLANKTVRTGRQRKKLAARSKGGEFRTKRRKRRVYFCCVSSDIDVQKLYDYLVGAGSLLNGWKYEQYADVLRLFKPGVDETSLGGGGIGAGSNPISIPQTSREAEDIDRALTPPVHTYLPGYSTQNQPMNIPTHRPIPTGFATDRDRTFDRSQSMDGDFAGSLGSASSLPERDTLGMRIGLVLPSSDAQDAIGLSSARSTMPMNSGSKETPKESSSSHSSKLSGIGAQEVFVFDFGAAVFWGFSRGEETNLLKTIRMFVVKGLVGASEFQSGEDDMAFVTTPEIDTITIANDVITLPEDAPTKQRLSVSFAIAQSTVLAIFEARIDRKIEEYKYIPEALAACGKVNLTERQLGIMIGKYCTVCMGYITYIRTYSRLALGQREKHAMSQSATVYRTIDFVLLSSPRTNDDIVCDIAVAMFMFRQARCL